MAERKAAGHRAPARPDLDALFERARHIKLTEEDLRAQRASFIYGNAPEGSNITKESALKAVRSFRITPDFSES